MKVEEQDSIIVRKDGPLGTISLNRPKVHNALDLQMIRDLTAAVNRLNRKAGLRLIVFTSKGKNFSAGADLHWMREGMNQEEEQLRKESLELAGLFRTIRESDALTIASVKGRILGGAIGLVAASDLVVAEHTATLTFSEVKLGLIPATIAPHVLRKAGHSRSAEWMLSARTIPAPEALEAGLFNRICPEGSLEESTAGLIGELLSNGPLALRGVKELLATLESPQDPAQVDRHNAKLIASFRISAEGQEGMKAFFEKRKPHWYESS